MVNTQVAYKDRQWGRGNVLSPVFLLLQVTWVIPGMQSRIELQAGGQKNACHCPGKGSEEV